nr:5-oxoprolinase subunit PxpA [Desulfatiglans anilini]
MAMTDKIDINCDMGESFGAYTLGMDADVMRYITSANIACGFHAGDPGVMNRTIQLARNHRVGVGAHPGFPDLLGFGRRNMDCTLDEIRDYVVYQVGAMEAFCRLHGVRLQHVKPHGGLYNMAAGNLDILRVLTGAVAALDAEILLVAPAGGRAQAMARIGREEGVRLVFEAFPDRAYTREGALVSRRLPEAVILDPQEVVERALALVVEGRISLLEGGSLEMEAQTLCVHGDNPGAVEMAAAIRRGLESEGIGVASMAEWV